MKLFLVANTVLIDGYPAVELAGFENKKPALALCAELSATHPPDATWEVSLHEFDSIRGKTKRISTSGSKSTPFDEDSVKSRDVW